MKKVIMFFLLLFIGVNGFAQKAEKDSIGSLWLYAETNRNEFIITAFKPDTVKSILFCADTSYIKGVENWIFRSRPDSSKDLHFYNRIPYVFWQFGYAIYPINQNIIYLDENKKRLKKSLVVFMSLNR